MFRAPTDPMQVFSAPTRFIVPSSVKAGPTKITFKNAGTKVHEVVVLKTDTPADKLKVGANHEVSEDASVGLARSRPIAPARNLLAR